MHGLARPIGNRLTPHSSGEVRPQIHLSLPEFIGSHGATANNESRPTRNPVSAGHRKSRPMRSAIVDVAIANTPDMRIAHVVRRL
jgi:hypothetical protein